MKINLEKLLRLTLAMALVAWYPNAHASNSTWSGLSGSSSNWADSSNWVGGVVPGTTGTAYNGDSATFSSLSGSGGSVVTLNNQDLRYISFDAGADSYTLTGGPLALNNGGILQLTGTAAGVTTPYGSVFTVAAPITLMGGYTISNSRVMQSATQTALLNIAGGITLGVSGTQTLSLTTLVGSGGAQSGGVLVSGSINEGAGVLSLYVSVGSSGSCFLTLTGTNSYTGGTIIHAGQISVSSLGALGNFMTTGTITMGQGSGSAQGLQFTGTGGVAAGTLNFGYFNGLSGITSTLDQSGSGLLNFTHDLVVTGTATRVLQLQGSTSGTGQFSGVICNGITANTVVSLVKSGTGTWILSNANTYTGATTGSSGGLNIQNNTALGSGTVTISSGAALQLQSGIAVNNVLNLAGSGVNNDGALRNISGTNTYSGPINLTGAIRINADAGSLYLTSGSIALGANTVTLGGGGNIVINSILSGSGGGLTKDGGGNVTLTASNSYTGLTIISSGTLSIGDGTAGNDGSIASSSSINLENAFSSLVYNLSSTATRTYSNLIFGSGSLTVSGSGTLTLAGTNTYTGPTLVTSSGALIFASNSSLGSSPISDRSIAGGITLPLTGGTATIPGITGTSTGNFTPIFLNSGSISTLVLNPGAGISNSSSAIINDGLAPMGLTKNGAGTQILTGANSYTGPTTISSGTLSVSILANGGSNSGIGASSSGSANLLFNGGTLQYTGGTVTFNRDAESLVTNSGIDVSNSNTNLIWSGAFINGTGHYISKYGLGTLTLSGSVSNSALSGMAVHSGTLVLAKSSGSVFGNLDVDAGATAVITGIASSQIGNHYFGVINGTWT